MILRYIFTVVGAFVASCMAVISVAWTAKALTKHSESSILTQIGFILFAWVPTLYFVLSAFACWWWDRIRWLRWLSVASHSFVFFSLVYLCSIPGRENAPALLLLQLVFVAFFAAGAVSPRIQIANHPVSAWWLFLVSAAAIPAWELVGASPSGERYFGQGLEGSLYSELSLAVHALCFLGFVVAPALNSQPSRRQIVLSLLAVIAFLVVELLSFMFIIFGMFPD